MPTTQNQPKKKFVSQDRLIIEKSQPLNGIIHLFGAKNATLPIMSSLLLTNGKSTLSNVPNSADTQQMIILLKKLGAKISIPKNNVLEIDTSTVNQHKVDPEDMKKMRASILVTGPLLARFNKAIVALPGGCLIGKRPIDFHIKGFRKLGASIGEEGSFLSIMLKNKTLLENERRIVFEYPSVGATENIMLCSTLIPGKTTIINAAFEPEIFDLIDVLKKMGAKINFCPDLTLEVIGVEKLNPIKHDIIPDRLEAGSLLLGAAVTGGHITIPNAQPHYMDTFLEKLKEMGHEIIKNNGGGISFKATKNPVAVNFKTAPYPGFPTDLQAPMMVAQCLANGISEIEETVFENRLMHAEELKKMGAQITTSGRKAIVRGVEELYGCDVIASDIRASCALAIAGLAAQGTTTMTGISHWKRGYQQLEEKFALLGGKMRWVKPTQ